MKYFIRLSIHDFLFPFLGNYLFLASTFCFHTYIFLISNSCGTYGCCNSYFIAGKKGANIQMLRSEYSANIKLPDSPGPERVFSVSAADAEIVADIIGKF